MSTTAKKNLIDHRRIEYKGYSYDGWLKNGIPNGQGFLRTGDEKFLIFEGHFKDGKYEHGTLFPDKINGILGYIGEFKEEKKDGKGILYKVDCREPIYIGEFKNDLYDGLGELFDDKGKSVFYGQFKEGEQYTPTSHLNPSKKQSKKNPSKKGGKKKGKTSKGRRKTSLKKSRKYKKN